jgi:hypothetical protein
MRTGLKYQNILSKIHIVFFLLLFASSIYAQTATHFYKDSNFSCKYHTLSGMLHGRYESFYKNGKKKSDGTFQYNSREGIWTVWDSTGKLRVKRIYTNPLEYIRMYPAVPAEGPTLLLNKPVYTLQRDSLGEWKNFMIAERTAFYQQRNFKCFYTSQKQLLFDCKTLFNILYSNAVKKNYSLYLGKKGDEDDTYSKRLNLSTADSILIDTTKVKLVGFRLKSDWIFDNIRLLSNERPLFITALVVDKVNPKDTFDLFDVYVPDVRKYLAQVKLADTNLPQYLRTLDDVFFFGCFSVEKWSVSSVFIRNTHIPTMPTAVNKRALQEVETENDLWLYFNKPATQ